MNGNILHNYTTIYLEGEGEVYYPVFTEKLMFKQAKLKEYKVHSKLSVKGVKAHLLQSASMSQAVIKKVLCSWSHKVALGCNPENA